MQKNSNNEEKNVFLQVQHGWRDFWDSFKNVSDSRKQTWFDEVATVTKAVLFVATISTGISYALSNHIFFSWLGEEYSWYPAITLAIVLELGTVFIGLLFCRGLMKRQTYYSAPALGIVIFTGFVFILAAKWGYKLSSEGQSQLSVMFATKQAQTDTSFVNVKEDPRLADINQELATINGGLGKQNDAQSNAYSIKWKRKTTEEGQKLADVAGKNISALNDQKAMLLAEKLKIESEQDSTRKGQRAYNVHTQAQWTNLFGGYMELFKIFCIAALACCMVGIENLDKEDEEDNPTPSVSKTQNTGHRRVIGFARNDPQNTVATQKDSSYSVATQSDVEKQAIYADSEIYNQVKNIQAWIAKFKKHEARLTTTDRNILTRLETVNRVVAEYIALTDYSQPNHLNGFGK